MAFQDQQDSPAARIERDRLALQRSLQTGVALNPDTVATDRREASRRGMPTESYVAAREQGQPVPPPGWDRLPEHSPMVSSFLANPGNAAVAHDDIESMSAVENIVRGIGSRAARLTGGLARTDRTLIGDVEDFTRRQLDRVGVPIFDWRTDAQGRVGLRRVRPDDQGRTRTTGAIRATEQATFGYEAGTTWEEVKASPLQNVMPFAIESGLVSIPDMAAAIAALPMYIAARTGEIGQQRTSNDTRQDATVEDLISALPAAAASALLERIGTRGIIGLDDAVRGGARGILPAVGRAGLKEGTTEALQGGIEYAGSNLGTEAGFDPAEAVDQMLAGAVAGTPFGATVRTATATAEVATGRFQSRAASAQAGEEGAVALEQLAALAEASKLRERAPEAFQQFVDQASEGTDVENVFVDAQTFAQSLTEAGLTTEEIATVIPSLAEQLPAALATGGDLRITAGEFAAHIAGTDAAAPLLEHLRVDPFAMSRAQADEFLKTQGDELQAEVEKAAAEAVNAESFRASADAVRERIVGELNTTGRFTADVNKGYGSLVANFYAATGARLGLTAEEMAERYPLKFSAELPGGDRRTLDQQETIEQSASLPPRSIVQRATDTARRFAQSVLGREEQLPPDAQVIAAATSAASVDVADGEGQQVLNQADPFYSALTRTVENSPTTKAPAAQYQTNSAAFRELTKPDSVRVVAEDFFGRGEDTVPTLDAVQAGVIAAFEHDQVREAVASDLSVDVVDDLASIQRSPQDLLRDPDVVVLDLTLDQRGRVLGGLLDATSRVGARLRTNLSDARTAGRDVEILPALRASEIDPRVIVGLLSPQLRYHDGALSRPVEETVAGPPTEEPAAVRRKAEGELDAAALAAFLNWHGALYDGTGTSYQAESFDQPNRGQIAFGADISQTPSVISLLRTADLSTFLHETGHFFLEVSAHVANQPDAPADVLSDMSAVLDWFSPGMTLEQWNAMGQEERRPYHEQFARGFEAYLFEGRAPSTRMGDLFRRFSAWLKNVYRDLAKLDVELTVEVRSVMDRMIASQEEIAAAEQARSFAPLFATRPEGMTEDEWTHLQRLGEDATAEAIEQLEQRSARDMRWASGTKDRYVKSLQREAEDQRKSVRAEVTAEVMSEPVNRARNFLRRGLDENGNTLDNAAKLDIATLKELYGEDGQWTALRRGGKYGEVATEGLHPDVVADMFGYASGEQLIADLVNGENAADKIKGLTDQRMLERYGDLSDERAIERAANEAVANEARAKFVAAESAALHKAIGKRSILNSAAREFAAGVVNRLELKRLRPAQYLAAQGRAAVAAAKAFAKDDIVGAATAKRNQLINLHAGRAVQVAQKDVEKTMRRFTRIVSAKDDSISRSRNMDLVNAARAVLSMYGVGRVKNDPISYMDAVKRYDPTLYADIEPFINGARGDAKPILDLTYEQFQALRDTVNQMWTLSRRSKQIEIDGKLMDRAVVTAELGQRLEDLGLPAQAGLDRALTDKDKIIRYLLGARAALRRVESWARGVDGGNAGPFRRYVWNPVSEAADRYRAESGDYIRQFRALLDTVKDELKPRDISAPEIGYTFGGKSELYHALLHTGNGSNKSKLLLGRRWGKKDADGALDDTQWLAFIDRLHAEGVLTAKDWLFIQSVWDLLETTKDGAQRAHHAVYGRYFDEIAADEVDTPFGPLRGGYVPALTDAFLVQDAVLRAEQEAIEGGDSAMFPAASNGFTKSRVEDYTRELALDLRLLPMHIDKVLKFTHLGPPVRDVARLLKDRGFSAKLQQFDPTAQSDLLFPWLQRAAKQIVETPTKGIAGKAADKFFSAVRSRVGMQLMFANVVNTAQQLTGFSNVMLRVPAPTLGAALWRYTRNPKAVAEAATGLSLFLTNRANTDLFEARQAITQLTKLNPNVKDEAVAFTQRHAYFMQSALQNVMDVVSWTAAFDHAVEQGNDQRDAIRFADSVIRETQGTMAPEDISRFETGMPFVRMFTQFAGYFNMMANLNATEVQLVARGVGLKKGAGRLFYIYLMGFAIPALLGDAIAKGLRGGWEDEQDDGYMDDLFGWFFSAQAKFGLAAVPVVGQAANAAIGSFTDLPYDDRLSMSPAVSVIESGMGTPAELYQSIVEGESFNRSDTRDALNLLGVLTGTPTGVLAKPAGYGVGVAQGDIEPTSAADAARGFVTGAPSPESRQ